jgi:S1-C subfamily serine protease
LDVELFREGRRQTVRVRIEKLDEKAPLALRPGAASSDDLGLNVEDLRSDIARQLGYGPQQRGAVVTRVDPSGLAGRAGIRAGDVITAIGGQAIESAADFRAALSDRAPEEGVRVQLLRGGVRQYVFLKGK